MASKKIVKKQKMEFEKTCRGPSCKCKDSKVAKIKRALKSGKNKKQEKKSSWMFWKR